MATDNIEDYYVNPFELGYGFYIGWKTDFIGKDALTKMKDQKNRKKVTLEWNRDDLLKVVASSFEEGVPYKWIDFPQPNYASTNADVLLNGKKPAGISMFNGYSFNERCMLSLGVVNDDVQDWRSAHVDLGRARDHGQDLDRTAPSGRDPRPRLADAVLPRSPRELRRQLADEVGKVTSSSAVALRQLLL